MIAKRFFYVCAGLLCLALVYHFGAVSATAQGGGPIDGPMAGSFNEWNTCVVGRTFYYQVGGLTVPVPIPGTARVIATGGAPPKAMLENGDVYVYDSSPASVGTWVLQGNMLGNPTPAQRETFGALKSRYRGSAQPQNR